MRNWIPVLAVVVLLGGACSGPSGQTGSLTVNLKDGPYADAMAMLVTFSGVSAHHADAEWQPLKFAGEVDHAHLRFEEARERVRCTRSGNYSPDTTHSYVWLWRVRRSTARQPRWPTGVRGHHDAAWWSHGMSRSHPAK